MRTMDTMTSCGRCGRCRHRGMERPEEDDEAAPGPQFLPIFALTGVDSCRTLVLTPITRRRGRAGTPASHGPGRCMHKQGNARGRAWYADLRLLFILPVLLLAV